MSAFGGKADIIRGKADIKKCPLMTQSGLGGCHSRAFQCTSLIRVLSLGGGNETTRVHHTLRRHSGIVAARCARAADREAGGRLFGRPISGSYREPPARISPGAERGWLCRGRKRHGSVSLCGESKRPITSARRRISSPISRCDRG